MGHRQARSQIVNSKTRVIQFLNVLFVDLSTQEVDFLTNNRILKKRRPDDDLQIIMNK